MPTWWVVCYFSHVYSLWILWWGVWLLHALVLHMLKPEWLWILLWWQRRWTLYGCLTKVLICSLVHYQKTVVPYKVFSYSEITTDKLLIALLLWIGMWCWSVSMDVFLQSIQFLEKCTCPIFFCLLFNEK